MCRDEPVDLLDPHPDADPSVTALCRYALRALPRRHRQALVSAGVRIAVAPSISAALEPALDAYAVRKLGRPLSAEARADFLAQTERDDTRAAYVSELGTIAIPTASVAYTEVSAALWHEVGHALLGPADLHVVRGFWPDGVPAALVHTIAATYPAERHVAEMASEAYVALITGRAGYDPALLAAIDGRIGA